MNTTNYTVSPTTAVWTTNLIPKNWNERIPPYKYGLIVEGPEDAPLTRIEWNGVWHRRVTRRGRLHYFRPEL